MISVIGGSESSESNLEIAEELGREIAKRDLVLVCGGMGGIMKSACKGAKSENGFTVGITPFDSKDASNDYCDIVIPTGLGYARNFLVAKAGDVVIAIDGSAGTLSEMAIAWFSDKPVIALTATGGWAEKLSEVKIDSRRSDHVFSAKNPKDALDIAFRVMNW
jgi:uncharacterized protein (TIGR00725 family)